MPPMRLYLVIDETRFYHPDFVTDLLRRTKDEIVGSAVITKVPAKSDLSLYLRSNASLLTWPEKFKLLFRQILFTIKGVSVRSVLKSFHIDFIEVENDINQPEYLNAIRAKKPDIIISSNSLRFGKELLKIPTVCCLNRHSGLLPAYGGLWPVFQAFRTGEQFTGVSVHTMEEALDKGIVLAQQKIAITANDTIADLYQKCFAASADVVLAAVEKAKRSDFSSASSDSSSSYFSFPTKEHWQDFRKRGGRFI